IYSLLRVSPFGLKIGYDTHFFFPIKVQCLKSRPYSTSARLHRTASPNVFRNLNNLMSRNYKFGNPEAIYFVSFCYCGQDVRHERLDFRQKTTDSTLCEDRLYRECV